MKSSHFTTALVAVISVGLLVGCDTGGNRQAATKPPAEAAQQAPTARTAEPGAISVVARALDGKNKLGVSTSDLESKVNPKGAGTFVYVAQTRFRDVERNLVWLVLDGRAYALNGPSKMLTPGLPWPREGDESAWKATGLNQFSATEAMAIVFGSAR
jgi:hypothetical protein